MNLPITLKYKFLLKTKMKRNFINRPTFIFLSICGWGHRGLVVSSLNLSGGHQSLHLAIYEYSFLFHSKSQKILCRRGTPAQIGKKRQACGRKSCQVLNNFKRLRGTQNKKSDFVREIEGLRFELAIMTCGCLSS